LVSFSEALKKIRTDGTRLRAKLTNIETALDARLAMAMTIFARPVDVEGMMGMLDRRDFQSARAELARSASTSVVLPLFFHPAMPKTRALVSLRLAFSRRLKHRHLFL